MSSAAVTKTDINGGARALRRYIVARADNREYGEWAKADMALGAWVFCTEAEAKNSGEIPVQRIRGTDMPWCEWLGNDTCIADNIALQTFFEVTVTDGSGWSALRAKVQRSPINAYAEWQRKGRELLNVAKARREGTEIPVVAADVPNEKTLAEKYARRGTGYRDIPPGKRS